MSIPLPLPVECTTLYVGLELAQQTLVCRALDWHRHERGRCTVPNRPSGVAHLVTRLDRTLQAPDLTDVLVGIEATNQYWQPIQEALDRLAKARGLPLGVVVLNPRTVALHKACHQVPHGCPGRARHRAVSARRGAARPAAGRAPLSRPPATHALSETADGPVRPGEEPLPRLHVPQRLRPAPGPHRRPRLRRDQPRPLHDDGLARRPAGLVAGGAHHPPQHLEPSAPGRSAGGRGRARGHSGLLPGAGRAGGAAQHLPDHLVDAPRRPRPADPGAGCRDRGGPPGLPGSRLAADAAGLGPHLHRWPARRDRRDRAFCRSSPALAHYAGLLWDRYQRGDFDGTHTRRIPTGKSYLRYDLVEGANSARVHAEEFKADYQRKRAERADDAHQRALLFTARKLVRILFYCLTHETPYQPPSARPARRLTA